MALWLDKFPGSVGGDKEWFKQDVIMTEVSLLLMTVSLLYRTRDLLYRSERL